MKESEKEKQEQARFSPGIYEASTLCQQLQTAPVPHPASEKSSPLLPPTPPTNDVVPPAVPPVEEKRSSVKEKSNIEGHSQVHAPVLPAPDTPTSLDYSVSAPEEAETANEEQVEEEEEREGDDAKVYISLSLSWLLHLCQCRGLTHPAASLSSTLFVRRGDGAPREQLRDHHVRISYAAPARAEPHLRRH